MLNDEELLRAFVHEGSQAAFAEFVQRHLDLVYSIALRQTAGNSHLADEVAQQVFMALAGKAHSLLGRPSIVGWLYRATQFAAIDAIRAEKRRRRHEMDAHAQTQVSFAPAELPVESLRPQLDAALARLSALDRAAVLGHFYEAKSFATLGRELHLSEDAARMRVGRGLKKLRKELRRTLPSLEAGSIGALIAGQTAGAAPPSLLASISCAALSATKPASLASLISIMTIGKKSVILGCALIAALATIGLETRSWLALGRELARESGLIAARRGELENLERTTRGNAVTVTTPSGRQAPASMAASAGQKAAAASPSLEAEARYRKFIRGRVYSQYYGFYRQMGWSQARILAFEETFMGQDNFDPAKPGSSSHEERLFALLGPGDYAALKAWGAAQDDHGARDIIVSAYTLGVPLTLDQSNQLRNVLATVGTSTGDQWAEIEAETAGFLSPEQQTLVAHQAARTQDRTVITQADKRAPISKQP